MMRAFHKKLLAGLVATILSLGALPSAAQDLIPDRRFVLTQDTDLPGGDLAALFDTTLEACQRACLTNQACTAFTFNTRNGSCFPKSYPNDGQSYAGAFSGFVVDASAEAEPLAKRRATELPFVQSWEVDGIVAQANGLANAHVTNGFSAEELYTSAVENAGAGDFATASRFVGAALNLTDAASDWSEYARLLYEAGNADLNNRRALHEQAFQASVNGYWRADEPGLQHSILVTMAMTLEALDRGRETVQALRLAQDLQPRDDTAAFLDRAAGLYGFRIVENVVQSDSARPRLCVNFSQDLAKSGVDYASFVQLASPELTISHDGFSQLCVEGVQHGTRQSVTFREGLPAADGQVLAKSVEITAYIRDRSPGVRFPGRGYVLPRLADVALPVETVNTETLDLTLFRVTDRNLLRAVQSGLVGQPMMEYQEADFSREVGTEIWAGSATVPQEVNKDLTTRLPLAEALADQTAGVFALRAAVPGVDPYVTPAAWQWFVVSDLGLTTLSGVDGLHVFVRSLGTAAAKEGTTVELLSKANEILATASTDAMGYARFDPALALGKGAASPAMVVAKDGAGDLAFLSLTDPEFDLSDRGVEGREAAPPLDVFLTTDRGAYRAGETVFATALARDAQAMAVESLPLTAVLKRPDGVEYSRALVADLGAGGHVFQLPIAGGAPRGVWRLEVYADTKADALSSKTFLVEDFLPERIDFAMVLDRDAIALGDTPNLTVDARYLFGAPGADLAIEGEVRLSAASALADFPGYVFGRHDQPFDAVMQSLEPARTDAAGQAVLALPLPQVDDPGRPLELRATLRVAEGSGRPVERQLTQTLAPSSPMIGIKPLFDGVVPEGAEARFQLIGLGAGDTAAAMPARWTLTRIETTYQWYQQAGNWNWEPVTKRERVAEGDVTLGKTPVEIAAPVGWGDYEIAVEGAGGLAARTSTLFSAGWYAPADASDSPDTLELSLDKPAYKAGETATLRLVPRAAGTALVMVLSNRLIAMQAVPVTEGENTLTLPVTDDWGAGVYVTASVLRPMDVAAGRNPARALGLTHALIDPGTKALTATIETAAEAAPRGPLDVTLRVDGVAAGETAYVTLAAVDQGILNLTAFAPPDPKGHYFGQRKLGIGLRDLYGRLIDGLNGAEGQVRSGGDSGAQARLQSPPPTEELVAYFTGPLPVGADGTVKTRFNLPSFNGSVKLMAVAWSKSGIGQASADVLVRDPVVVTASLPRFMAPGDDSRLLLEIVHATGPSGQMGLTLSSPGLRLGPLPDRFDLAEKAKAVFAVPVTADEVGLQTIDITLTTPDGKALKKTLSLPVQRNDPPVQRISRFDLEPGQTFTLDQSAFAGLVAGSGRATLAAGPIARLNAPGILASLDRYPYGCTEQLTAKALPLLYFDTVAAALNLPQADSLKGRIDGAITDILMNQSSAGGFGLWGPADGDMWLDAFVTDFLSRAAARGYAVPDLALRRALDNLRNQVNYHPDFDSGGEALAYALMVLAREGAAAVGDLRYYADVKGDAFATPAAMAQLGAALASYGDQTRADAMFRRAAAATNAAQGPEVEQIFRADYGTPYRDAAAVLALATEAGSAVVDRDALTNQLVTDRGLSTQEATWALLAAHAMLDGTGDTGITIDGAAASGPLVRVFDAASAAPVQVANSGAAATTITLTTLGAPLEPEPAGGNGYAITRSYYTLQGEPAGLENLAVGDRLVTVLEVTPFGRGEARLMVSDPLPAGFEIDNPNLITGGAIEALDGLGLEPEVAHSEFRQDRFLSAIDRFTNAPFKLAYVVRAVSPGSFHHPAPSVEDMYRPDLTGRGDTGRVTISP
jgi:alpha-2-macroglobulin